MRHRRLSCDPHSGLIFDAKDPIHRSVDVPVKFFKDAVSMYQGEAAATGYVVDQTEILAELPDVPKPYVTGEALPPGQVRTFQAPIRNIAALTGPDLKQLVAVDRMPIAALPSARVTSTWGELHSPRTSTWTSTSTAERPTAQASVPSTANA